MRNATHKPRKQNEALTDDCSKPTKSMKKPRRGPLPMKMRALPQSFWQQPNTTGTVPPSDCEPIPPLSPLGEDMPGGRLEVTPADTDLLFSLFSALPSVPQPGLRPAIRRGRPRKNIDKKLGNSKDKDPYVTSATVPEVKFQKEAMAETKALALMAFNDNHNGTQEWQTSNAQRLQDLALNL